MQKLIDKLKQTYNRDTRKQLVKSILEDEKSSATPEYKMIDQIFSYVIQESSWQLAQNSTKWNNTPLLIMSEVFPGIENTKWYKDKDLTITP